MIRTLIVGLLLTACTSHSVATSTVSRSATRPLCAVLSERSTLDGKEVIIEAVFQQTPHGMMLFSEGCEDSFTHLEWQRADYASSDVVEAKDGLLKGKPYRRLSVVVRGVLRIAHRYECFGPNCLRQKIDGLELLRVEPQAAMK
jgi:hypothetical protein